MPIIGPEWKSRAEDRIDWTKMCEKVLEKYAGASSACFFLLPSQFGTKEYARAKIRGFGVNLVSFR